MECSSTTISNGHRIGWYFIFAHIKLSLFFSNRIFCFFLVFKTIGNVIVSHVALWFSRISPSNRTSLRTNNGNTRLCGDPIVVHDQLRKKPPQAHFIWHLFQAFRFAKTTVLDDFYLIRVFVETTATRLDSCRALLFSPLIFAIYLYYFNL